PAVHGDEHVVAQDEAGAGRQAAPDQVDGAAPVRGAGDLLHDGELPVHQHLGVRLASVPDEVDGVARAGGHALDVADAVPLEDHDLTALRGMRPVVGRIQGVDGAAVEARL